jgi:hypothetical protein
MKKASSKRTGLGINGAAGRIRTHDPLVRSQVLYPTELQPRELQSIARLAGELAAFCGASKFEHASKNKRIVYNAAIK